MAHQPAAAKARRVDTGEVTPLRFVAGMFGVDQDPDTRALSPVFGWAIVYEEEA